MAACLPRREAPARTATLGPVDVNGLKVYSVEATL